MNSGGLLEWGVIEDADGRISVHLLDHLSRDEDSDSRCHGYGQILRVHAMTYMNLGSSLIALAVCMYACMCMSMCMCMGIRIIVLW